MSSECLNINEIFYSIQGEGPYTGCAAVFVRLAGCTMGCSWCDTKYAAQTNMRLAPQSILDEIKKYNCPRIVITGGEPCEQQITPLLDLLHSNGFEIHIETNGSINIDTQKVKCLTVSPKRNPHPEMLKKADAIKCVVDDNPQSSSQAIDYQKYLKNGATLFIQPEGNKKENLIKCLELIKQNPQIRLSVQLHKLIDVK